MGGGERGREKGGRRREAEEGRGGAEANRQICSTPLFRSLRPLSRALILSMHECRTDRMLPSILAQQ